MGHSYIEHNNNWIRLNDGYIVRFLTILCDTAEHHSTNEWLSGELYRWQKNAVDAGPGLIDIDFVDLLANQKSHSVLLSLLEATESRIENEPLVLSGEWVNKRLGSTSMYFEDIAMESILPAFREFSDFVTVLLQKTDWNAN